MHIKRLNINKDFAKFHMHNTIANTSMRSCGVDISLIIEIKTFYYILINSIHHTHRSTDNLLVEKDILHSLASLFSPYANTNKGNPNNLR